MVKPSSNQILKLNKLEAYPISKETHVENYKTCFKTPNKTLVVQQFLLALAAM